MRSESYCDSIRVLLTEQIRIGTTVITLPLHHPVRVAEEIALVDVLSGGRVDVGVGRGYQSVEFDAFGLPLAEARARTDEALAVLPRPVDQGHGEPSRLLGSGQRPPAA